jgi:hypothetical protein
MQLRYSPTSPYVRKVMVTAIETGLDQDIEKIPTNSWDARHRSARQQSRPRKGGKEERGSKGVALIFVDTVGSNNCVPFYAWTRSTMSVTGWTL